RIGRSSVPADYRPACGGAERRAKHDVAEEMTVVVQPRRRDVTGDDEGRPGALESEMPLEYRGRGERRRCMAGRERAAFAGRPVALADLLHDVDHRLGDDLRTDQIESEMRQSVRVIRSGIRRQDVPADQIRSNAGSHLCPSAEVFTGP